MKRMSRAKFKEFLMRRKINAFTLLTLTVFSAVITFLCALAGFSRTDVLVGVTLGLIALCIMQAYKLRSSYRTMRMFRGTRKKRRPEEGA